MSETPADTVSETVYSALYDDDEARVCKDVPESACQHQPRNWVFSTLSLSLTKTGDALVDPKLTLTWLLGALGAPAFLIGLLAPVREAGALLPQLQPPDAGPRAVLLLRGSVARNSDLQV